jgi:hypothetical protein
MGPDYNWSEDAYGYNDSEDYGDESLKGEIEDQIEEDVEERVFDDVVDR